MEQALVEVASSEVAELSWTTPSDLGRRSIEAFIGQSSLVRVLASSGRLRLHGTGVTEHSIRIADLGGVLTSFQRTVSAVGGALEGFTAARGALPAALATRTNLMLSASPGEGSIVLTMSPEQSAVAELYPTGEVPLAADDRPLADRSLERVIKLLAAGVQDTAGSTLIRESLVELGPRVASAVRAFLRIVADDALDFDLSWREPDRPTTRTSVTATQARFIETVIGLADLDVEELVLDGVVRTVSDIRPLDLSVDGQIWKLQLGEDRPPNLGQLKIGDRVRAKIVTTREQRAGGSEIATHALISVDLITETGDSSTDDWTSSSAEEPAATQPPSGESAT